MSAPSAVCPKANSARCDRSCKLPGKYSRQREIIYRTVVESHEHPTADEVYQAVREHCPDISLGTVYRNLGRLAECGVIRKIGVSDGSDRFDGTLEEHYHLLCTGCGCVTDVDLPGLGQQLCRAGREAGFEVEKYELILHGLCKDCAQKKIKENEE